MERKAYPNNSNYLIGEDGSVLSVRKNKILKPQVVTGDYLYLKLRLDGKPQYKAVHRLVAETWIPNSENLPEVNHKDGDKTNNSSLNLEWSTRSENEQHKFREGLDKRKLDPQQVISIRQRLNEGEAQVALASEFGVTPQTIYYIKSGHIWSHV